MSDNRALTDPWLVAHDRYLEGLTEHEKMLFSSATLENLFDSANDVHEHHRSSSRCRAFWMKIQPLVDAIEDYGKALDVYANASSLILCSLWGSIRVLLHVEFDTGASANPAFRA